MFNNPFQDYVGRKNQKLHQFLQNLNIKDTKLNEKISALHSELYIECLVVYPNRMTKSKEMVWVPSLWGDDRRFQCTRYDFKLPYTGDSNLFHHRGSTIFFDNMEFDIRNQCVIFQITDINNSAEQVAKDKDSFIQDLQKHLDSVNDGARRYNESLKQSLEEYINRRIKELIDKRKEEELAGLPPDEDDVNGNVIIPLVLKPKLEPRIELPWEISRETNYSLDLGTFDEIISSITHTATYMENHLDSFSYMKEEHIRDHILSMLNGMLSIRVTGETFNGKGKTDILYPYKEKNLFIAECKIWHGQKEFLKAIEQLEGYLGWNDAKAALLIFYHNKESMSEKIDEMRNVIKTKSNYRVTLFENIRGGRFLVDHPQDCKKSFYLELIVFNFSQT